MSLFQVGGIVPHASDSDRGWPARGFGCGERPGGLSYQTLIGKMEPGIPLLHPFERYAKGNESSCLCS
jgi:hypothetical protein